MTLVRRADAAGVATLTLARPEKRNALNMAMAASNLEGAMQVENRNQLLAGRSNDAREAQRAFLEKRKPVYANS